MKTFNSTFKFLIAFMILAFFKNQNHAQASRFDFNPPSPYIEMKDLEKYKSFEDFSLKAEYPTKPRSRSTRRFVKKWKYLGIGQFRVIKLKNGEINLHYSGETFWKKNGKNGVLEIRKPGDYTLRFVNRYNCREIFDIPFYRRLKRSSGPEICDIRYIKLIITVNENMNVSFSSSITGNYKWIPKKAKVVKTQNFKIDSMENFLDKYLSNKILINNVNQEANFFTIKNIDWSRKEALIIDTEDNRERSVQLSYLSESLLLRKNILSSRFSSIFPDRESPFKQLNKFFSLKNMSFNRLAGTSFLCEYNLPDTGKTKDSDTFQLSFGEELLGLKRQEMKTNETSDFLDIDFKGGYLNTDRRTLTRRMEENMRSFSFRIKEESEVRKYRLVDRRETRAYFAVEESSQKLVMYSLEVNISHKRKINTPFFCIEK